MALNAIGSRVENVNALRVLRVSPHNKKELAFYKIAF